MGRKVLFGGPQLPNGTHTWYERRNSDGSYGGQRDIHPGEVLDEEEIGGDFQSPGRVYTTWDPEEGKIVERSEGPLTVRHPTADYYVSSGRASFMTGSKAVTTEGE